MVMFNLFRKNICPAPFEQVYVQYNDDVWFCCDGFWKHDSSLGSLKETSFEKIWNSDKARQIRRRILKNDFSSCIKELCINKTNYEYDYLLNLSKDKKPKYREIMKTYPRLVFFNTDCECNVRCITCREEIYRLSNEELKIQNEKIERYYLPLLKDTEFVRINGTGEIFGSRHSRALTKAIVAKYPSIKFYIQTNGLLCNKYNCDELGITDRIESVVLSVNAATKETYDKTVIGSNFEKVITNLYWLKESILNNNIKKLYLVFVVTSLNYKEMPAFAEMAKDLNAQVHFWQYNDWGTNISYTPEFLSVSNPKHPEFKQFLNVLKSYDFNQDYILLSPYFQRLQFLINKRSL